jgi:ABC-2 type transport system permease protein
MTGTIALSRLEVRRSLRNRRTMFFAVLYPTILFLAIGGSATWTVDGVPGKTYELIAMASFGALGAALTTNANKIALERKEGWTRQLRLTALPGSGYVTSKVVAAMATTVPAVAVVFAVGAATGVHLSLALWLEAFLILWIGSLAFTALGIAIGYGVPYDSVQLVSIIVYIGFSLIGGLWFPLGGVMGKFAKYSPSYQVRQLAMDAVTKTHLSVDGLVILVAWLIGSGALAAAMYRRGVTAD